MLVDKSCTVVPGWMFGQVSFLACNLEVDFGQIEVLRAIGLGRVLALDT